MHLLRDALLARRSELLRAAAIAGCLVAILVLTPRLLPYAKLLVLGAAALVALSWQPELLLPGLVAVSLLVPVAFGTGTQTEVPITLVLLGGIVGAWLLEMLRHRRLRLAPSPANLPWLVLIVVAGLSIVVGDALWNPLVETKGNFTLVQLAQWGVFLFSAGAFWLAANVISGPRALRLLTWCFLGVGAFYLAVRVVLGYAPQASWLLVRGAAGSVFWVWLVTLSAGQALFNRRMAPAGRTALALLALTGLGVAFFQSRGWVAGWAPPFAALLLLLWLRSPRLGAATTLGLGVGMRLAAPGFFAHLLTSAASEGSFLRIPAWRGVVQLVGNRWPIGLGLAAYWHYWRALLQKWVWSSTNVVSLSAGQGVNTHNNYMDLYAQMGVIGLLAFAWLAVALWRQGWRMRARVPEGFARGYVCACLAGLAGTLASGMLADWFLPFVYNVGLTGMRSSLLAWLFLGGLVALEQAAPEREGGRGAA